MMTPLRYYNSAEEAYIVRGLLENNGIEAVVQNGGGNSVFPSLEDDGQGYTLYVDGQQAGRAEEVLRQHKD